MRGYEQLLGLSNAGLARRLGRPLILRFGLLTAGLLAFILAPTVTSHFYHHRFGSLARLKNTIEIGNSYDSLERRFTEFKRDHPASIMTNDRTVHHLLEGPVPAAQQLFIYRKSAFGEAYLQVLFDRDRRVFEISYLVD
jgi:hypothetical protein